MARRVLLLIAASVVLLVVVAAGVAYWFFGRDGFRTSLEAQASSWVGQPVRIGTARAQFLPRLAIQLGDIRVGEPTQLALDDVELASDLRPLLSGRIENADVRISGSRIDMPLAFGLPQQEAAGAEPDTTSEPLVRIVSVRFIALRSVRLRSRGHEIIVSADSSYDGSTLTLQRFTAESGGTTLDAEGLVALSPRVDAKLKASANRLDVDELIALAAAFAPPSAGTGRSSTPAPRIAATIAAGQATAAGVQASNFAADLTRDGDAITLKSLRLDLFGGRYEGAITARLGDQLTARIESKVTDLDVAQLAAFGGAADTITGRLSGAGTFTGAGSDFAQLLHAARGSGTATIVDGTIRNLHLVRTIVLFFGRPTPDADAGTDAFQRLDVGFTLSNRLLRADPFTFHSTDADMNGTGTLNLTTDALEGRVNVTLSEALSAQAGTDLIRYTREGNRVVLPAAIGGSLAMPRLTIDVGAAAKRGIRNEAERRIKGLLEGLGR